MQIANSSPLSFERRQRILEIVKERSSISVDELAAIFTVSAITIRRDYICGQEILADGGRTFFN